MGTADTPALPISGLTFPCEIKHNSLPINRPPIVPIINAIKPSATIFNVFKSRNDVPTAIDPTLIPRNIVIPFISPLLAVCDSLSVTIHSLSRLPSISMPKSGKESGKIRPHINVITIGNTIFSRLETGRNCSIFIARSFFVVSNFIIGGWIIGISAIYEYAATVIADNIPPSTPIFVAT